MKLVPPNFGMVEEHIHRCGMPSPVHFPFLESLALKTCVVLCDEVDAELEQWLRESNINTLYPLAAGAQPPDAPRGVGGYASSQRGSMTLPEPTVIELLQLLLDPANYPVLITCATGRHRTGITVGCLRKLQGWNVTSILEEYRRFAGSRGRIDNEEFVELFDVDSVSKSLPNGRRPTILYHQTST